MDVESYDDEQDDMLMMEEYPSEGEEHFADYESEKKMKKYPTRKSVSSVFNDNFHLTKIIRKNSMASDKSKSFQRDGFKLKLLKSKQIVTYANTHIYLPIYHYFSPPHHNKIRFQKEKFVF